MNKQQTLDAAKAAVADRGANYGKPEDNFQRIAVLWEAHFQNRAPTRITTADVAIMMCLMKLARLENQPNHDDSWIDVAGYAACGADLFDESEAVENIRIDRAPNPLWRNRGAIVPGPGESLEDAWNRANGG